MNGYQVLESVEADFGEMTWTFRLEPSNRVSGGQYAVLYVERFMKMNSKLERAEEILRSLRKIKFLCDLDREMIDKFFDPEPLG